MDQTFDNPVTLQLSYGKRVGVWRIREHETIIARPALPSKLLELF